MGGSVECVGRSAFVRGWETGGRGQLHAAGRPEPGADTNPGGETLGEGRGGHHADRQCP